MTPAQKLLLKMINERGRPLTDAESFDFYTEHVMRNDASCRINHYNWDDNGKMFDKHDDYPLWQLEDKAKGWHKLNVGSLVLQGALPINPQN